MGQTAASARSGSRRLEENNKFSAATLNRCVPVNPRTHREREPGPDSTPAKSAATSPSALLYLSERQRNNDQQRVNKERKANLLFQIYLSLSAGATLHSDGCPLFWVVV